MTGIIFLVVIAIAVTVVQAEAPRFARQRFQPKYPGVEPPHLPARKFRASGPFFARQEVAIATAVEGGQFPSNAPGNGGGQSNGGAPESAVPPTNEATPVDGVSGGAPYPPPAAPYPASGYRPSKSFFLPTEQRAAPTPATKYGPPAPSYLPPSPSYGPPSSTTQPAAQDEIPTPEFPEAEADSEDASEVSDLAKLRAEKNQEKDPVKLQPIFLIGFPTATTFQKLALVNAPVVNQALVQTQPVLLKSEPVPNGFSYMSQYSSTW